MRLAVLLALAGCGRIGFDPLGDAPFVPGVIACARPVLRDDFDDGTLDTSRWGVSAASEANGELTIIPATLDQFEGLYAQAPIDFNQHWAASEFVQLPASGSGGTVGFRFDRLSETDYPYAQVDNGMIEVGIYTPATPAPLVRVAFDDGLHRMIRMRDSGPTLFWETSPDGGVWTVIAETASPTSFLRTARLHVFAYDSTPPLDTLAILDQVVVCPN